MLTDAEIERFTNKYGVPSAEMWSEASSEERLRTVVAQIRREECAFQVLPGRQVVGLAVPVFKHDRIVASLSIYLPEYRFMAIDKMTLVNQLKSTAQKISDKLRH